jgi:membrane-associated phospholipid phosphatase
MRTSPVARRLLAVLLLFATLPARAGGGLLGLDHVVPYDDSGIWARKNQNALLDLLIIGEVAGALWEGGETRFGRTLWQSVDASAFAGIASTVLKYSFSRSRPSQTSNPNEWFQGGGHQSFPSGEVTGVSAIVSPLVFEYGAEHPSVYLLEALPVYDAIARVKAHGHWQSDVIAGFALGTGTAYLVHRRKKTPIILSVMPHGIYVGIRTH